MAQTRQDSYRDGQDYIKLPEEVRRNPDVFQLLQNDPNKVQILFFFSYGCPACARFDPPFEKWVSIQKAKQVTIYRVPVAFKEEWETLAKLYFTMKYLDPKLSLDEKIFDAIHNQNLQLWQEPKMKEFFTQNGYNSKEFEQAYNSFSVARETKEAENLSKAYGIAQTPTIIVNGPIDSYQGSRYKTGQKVSLVNCGRSGNFWRQNFFHIKRALISCHDCYCHLSHVVQLPPSIALH